MKTRALVAAAIIVTLAASAHAQQNAAISAFKAGLEAYAKGDYHAAAESFERANGLAPAPAALYNAGRAWQAAGDPVRAANDFAEALAENKLDASQSADARTRLASLVQSLGRLRFEGPTADVRVSIDDGELHQPRGTYLEHGTHNVVIMQSDGSRRSETVRVQDGSVAVITLIAPEPKPVVVTPTSPTPATDSGNGRRTFGWVTLGVGAATLVTGYAVGIIGVVTNSNFQSSGNTDASLRDQALTLRTVANVLIVAGGVVGVSGLVIALTAPKSRTQVGVGLGNVWVSGSF